MFIHYLIYNQLFSAKISRRQTRIGANLQTSNHVNCASMRTFYAVRPTPTLLTIYFYDANFRVGTVPIGGNSVKDEPEVLPVTRLEGRG